MSLDSLGAFVSALDEAGELVRVREPVSTVLEITEVADRVMKSPGGGPGLLFERPVLPGGTISDFPLAINLFGSMRRINMALGSAHLDGIGARITELLRAPLPKGLSGMLGMLPKLIEAAAYPPRSADGAPACHGVVLTGQEVDIGVLPHLTCWPGDGGRYITWGMVVTRDPATGIRNVGLYRVMLQGPRELAMHWQRHKVGAAHWRDMAERGEKMPVAIVLGADPASMYAASAPLPPSVDEFLFAGFLRKSPVRLTRCVTSDLEVPAESEIVIEGFIDPAEPLVMEGPFGDHTGFYSLADRYPLMHVTALTHRRGAICPGTIVGPPPMEDYYLGHATERIFLPLLRLTIPELVDYHMPSYGIFHNLVFVSIDKKYPGQAFKVANGLWGAGLMSLAKVIVVLDKWVNVQDADQAWWVALNNIDPERDARFTMGPMDVLDHSSRAFTFGSKMVLDATKKLPEEGFTREWPELIVMNEATKKKVDAKWASLGIRLP